MKPEAKLIYFHSRKCIWKCRLRNCCDFGWASMCLRDLYRLSCTHNRHTMGALLYLLHFFVLVLSNFTHDHQRYFPGIMQTYDCSDEANQKNIMEVSYVNPSRTENIATTKTNLNKTLHIFCNLFLEMCFYITIMDMLSVLFLYHTISITISSVPVRSILCHCFDHLLTPMHIFILLWRVQDLN